LKLDVKDINPIINIHIIATESLLPAEMPEPGNKYETVIDIKIFKAIIDIHNKLCGMNMVNWYFVALIILFIVFYLP